MADFPTKREFIEWTAEGVRLGNGHKKGFSGQTKSSSASFNDSARTTGQKLGTAALNLHTRAIESATGGLKLMHGGMDDFVYSLRGLARLIPAIVGGGIIDGLIKGAESLTKSYSRMANAGQMFGGSMFTMAAQAGASGLSLDEFTKMIEKHSETEKYLDRQTGTSANSLGALQLAVRNNLKPLGFLGMTVDQLSDATADYTDNLKQTGLMGQMTDKEQGDAVSEMIKNVAVLSDVTGKTRDEIMKNMNAAFADVTEQFFIKTSGQIGPAQKKSLDALTLYFSALPGSTGSVLSKFFAATVGSSRGAFMTEFGKAALATGLGDVVGMADDLKRKMLSGNVDMAEDGEKARLQIMRSIERQKTWLEAVAPTNADARAMMQVYLDLASMGKGDMAKYIIQQKRLQAEEEVTKGLTTNLLTLEHRFKMITGTFLDGFYSALASITDAFFPKDETKEGMEEFTKMMKALGTAVGTLLGNFMNLIGIAFGAGSFQEGVKNLTAWITSLSQGKALPEFIVNLKTIFHKIGCTIYDAFNVLTSQAFLNAVSALATVIIGVGNALGFLLGKIDDLLTFLSRHIPGVSTETGEKMKDYAEDAGILGLLFPKTTWRTLKATGRAASKMFRTAPVAQTAATALETAQMEMPLMTRVLGGAARGGGVGAEGGGPYGAIAGVLIGAAAAYFGDKVLDKLSSGLPGGAPSGSPSIWEMLNPFSSPFHYLDDKNADDKSKEKKSDGTPKLNDDGTPVSVDPNTVLLQKLTDAMKALTDQQAAAAAFAGAQAKQGNDLVEKQTKVLSRSYGACG
jgi:hypothetical protein